MVFERPKRQGQPQQPPSAIQRPNPATKRTGGVNPKTEKGNGGSGGDRGTGDRGGNPGIPSPWLDPANEPTPDPTASFVEYLRWMRSLDSEYKDATKVQLLQMAEEGANYRDRLTQLTKRTQLIASDTFQVKCPWRMRVGGHRGPESILLPAFDALGMPYIPSSTLRGVARTQAIREIMVQKRLKWEAAEKEVAPYFGSLEAKNPAHQAGKVIFFDAYPLPNQPSGGLAMDMANNIWKWDGNSMKYEPNPNPFFCLHEATFLIGIRLASGCNDRQLLNQVKQWLTTGLQSGVGSQINTGYGELIRAGKVTHKSEFFRINFTLEGQLIHGKQKYKNSSQPYQKDSQGNLRPDRQGRLKPDTLPEAEVRPVAFKSMLRYWFRTFALGVLEPEVAKSWEAKVFGAINPKERGWLMVRILEGKVTQKEPRSNRDGQKDPCGVQEGILTLHYSPEAPQDKQDAIKKLCQNLTWLMFHLGGIGQGARRPCYSRQNRQAAPWWRGSTLIADSDDSFWNLPDSPQEFQKKFQQRLQDFYAALTALGASFNYRSPKAVGSVSDDLWSEAVDANCRIVVCAGKEDFGKPYALGVLHSSDLKVKDREGRDNYNPNLCGKVGRPPVKPSPVWIADLGEYQLVTIFGASSDPRKKYLTELRDRTSRQSYFQIYPLT
ncbi:MAG: RAMP superfamily CRISPR-associated protein [Aulosira sp. ZfuVER01]|nr:RAMP superfamily CRISPR-associated protein [Aulosira sp. ZfuVER01]MDZ8001707.1 RAMP superfamily CRISPR-associated protein [Aulosira sp. DedVER01a]MDZ8055191.1 RAMP superfamily CRISPR-associated protein [Aulosira sp. ZfuCHP01]